LRGWRFSWVKTINDAIAMAATRRTDLNRLGGEASERSEDEGGLIARTHALRQKAAARQRRNQKRRKQ